MHRLNKDCEIIGTYFRPGSKKYSLSASRPAHRTGIGRLQTLTERQGNSACVGCSLRQLSSDYIAHWSGLNMSSTRREFLYLTCFVSFLLRHLNFKKPQEESYAPSSDWLITKYRQLKLPSSPGLSTVLDLLRYIKPRDSPPHSAS